MVRLAVSILALLASALPAMAGDRAALDVIGYSEDARYFAFEEFGIQDGSGFAYSSVYVIDLSTDTWVVGTPIRVQADDSDTALSAVRGEAQAEAAEQIGDLGIDHPADIVALNGDGVPDTEAQVLRFGVPGYLPGSVIGDYELLLSRFDTTAAAPCKEWFSIEPQGYYLSIADGDSERLIHRDGDLPRSRGCPTSYRVYGVALPFMAQSIDDAVALISVYPGGFEGPDRRFIAVPLGL
jgi:predicted secreted protein